MDDFFFGLRSFQTSDGSGPKKSSPGRAQALNVKLGPGPGLSPSLKAGPRAGPGGLAGLSLSLINPKNINFTQNSSKVNFLNFIRMLEKWIKVSRIL